MNVWFTSDCHLDHENILKYCDRPFVNVKEMNELIIKNFNDVVKDTDVVYFLGDFAFKNHEEHLSRLNGIIVFVLGNHDSRTTLKTHIKKIELLIKNQELLCVHNPADCEEGFRVNLVGHVHTLWKTKKTKKGNLLINVGVDQWNFKPVHYNELKRLMK